MAAPLFAEVVFLDDFDTDGASTDFHWYVRGGNLEEEKNVKEGNLLLARKDGQEPVARNSGIWRSFDTVTLGEGEKLRLTIAFSGAEVESAPFFRIVLADSQSRIDSNGGIMAEPAPRFAYVLGLPAGATVSLPEPGENLGFFEGTSEVAPPADFRIADCLMAFLSPPVAQPVFSDAQKVLESGSYDNKAVLVWELTNENGVIVSKGSWTDSKGNQADMLDVRAEKMQHFDFNKIGIGFCVWDAEWADGSHLAESVEIDSVQLEKF